MLSKIKTLLKKLPFPLSRNHRYDLLTKKIIRHYCHQNSNCIDAGAHEGDVLNWFLKYAPKGKHFAFEPLPLLYKKLSKKFSGKNCSIHKIALSKTKSVAPFNYVISNPAYSGLLKRKYDKKEETDTTIKVQTNLLDDIIPSATSIHFIKIDVEGGEMNVLKGSTRILSVDHPLIVFEFGIGGSDVYGTTPEEMYFFLETFDYKIFLLENFVQKKAALSLSDFQKQFYNRHHYYFVACYSNSCF